MRSSSLLFAVIASLSLPTSRAAADTPPKPNQEAVQNAIRDKLGEVLWFNVDSNKFEYVHVRAKAFDEKAIELLADLQNLACVRIVASEITPGAWKRLQTLTPLEHVNIDSCGAIPDDGWKSLEKLPNLRQLTVAEAIDDNDWKRLAKLPELRELSVNQDIPRGGWDVIVQLRELRRLEIYKDVDADLAGLDGLRNLTHLELTGTNLTPAAGRALGRLKELQSLQYWGESPDEFLENLGGACELKELRAYGSLNATTGRGLAKLPALESLILQDGLVTGDGLKAIANLPKLTNLNLNSSDLDDAGLVHLTPMRGLRQLSISATKVTAPGRDCIAATLPDCKLASDYSRLASK